MGIVFFSKGLGCFQESSAFFIEKQSFSPENDISFSKNSLSKGVPKDGLTLAKIY